MPTPPASPPRTLAINLDRSAARLAWLLSQPGAAGLAIERLAAIDGRTLSAESCAALLRPETLEPMTAGVVACFLSHRRAWAALADSGEAWMAILEDDVHLAPDAVRVLGDTGWIPDGIDIVKLDTMLEPTWLSLWRRAAPGGRRLHRLLGLHSGGAGYLLSRPAALRLLEATRLLEGPVDLVLFDPRSSLFAGLRSYQLVPALCAQDETLARHGAGQVLHVSDLEADRQGLLASVAPPPAAAKPRLPPLRKAGRELSRPFRQLAGKLACLAATGAWPRRRIVPFR